ERRSLIGRPYTRSPGRSGCARPKQKLGLMQIRSIATLWASNSATLRLNVGWPGYGGRIASYLCWLTINIRRVVPGGRIRWGEAGGVEVVGGGSGSARRLAVVGVAMSMVILMGSCR